MLHPPWEPTSCSSARPGRGRKLRLRGKPVDMQLEGADLREIAPAAVWLAE